MHTVYICTRLYRVPHACLHTHVYTPHSTHAASSLPGVDSCPTHPSPASRRLRWWRLRAPPLPSRPGWLDLAGPRVLGPQLPRGLTSCSSSVPVASLLLGAHLPSPLPLPAPRSSPPTPMGLGPRPPVLPAASFLSRPSPCILTPSLEPGHPPALDVSHRSTRSGTLCSGTV